MPLPSPHPHPFKNTKLPQFYIAPSDWLTIMFRLIRTDPGFRAEVDRLTCNNSMDDDPGTGSSIYDVTKIFNFFRSFLSFY